VPAALLVAVVGPSPVTASAKGDYIVVLKDVPSAAAVAAEHAEKLKGKLKHVYEDALKGYAIELNENQVEKLAADPRVDYVEPD
jgi:Peptidase inhibitor I9